jgi:hypothetical protein
VCRSVPRHVPRVHIKGASRALLPASRVRLVHLKPVHIKPVHIKPVHIKPVHIKLDRLLDFKVLHPASVRSQASPSLVPSCRRAPILQLV